MTQETDVVEVGAVRVTWDAGLRLARVEFPRPKANPDEADARALTDALARWGGAEPYRILFDVTNLADAQAGWRAVFADFFPKQPNARLALFNPSPYISMMVHMFSRATGVEVRQYQTEREALDYLGLANEARR